MTIREKGIIWAAMSLPTFHTMGIYTQVYTPLVSGTPVGLYAPQAPASPVVPSPALMLDTCKLLKCTGAVMVPSFMEVSDYACTTHRR